MSAPTGVDEKKLVLLIKILDNPGAVFRHRELREKHPGISVRDYEARPSDVPSSFA